MAESFGGETFQAVIAASGYCDRVTFFETGTSRPGAARRPDTGRRNYNSPRCPESGDVRSVERGATATPGLSKGDSA